MLMFLPTTAKWVRKEASDNTFVQQRKSTDFTNAKLTVRLRGAFDPPKDTRLSFSARGGEVPMGLQGSQLLLLVQAETKKTTANFVLTGQPFHITREWSEQTVALKPDPSQWTCLGSRDPRSVYGCDDISEVLKNVNLDIIFVLFPLKVVPIGKVGIPHLGRAGEDYPVKQEFLPKGLLMVDTVRIEYPH
jgi:hypothetical protein